MAQGKRGAAAEIERIEKQGQALNLRRQGKVLRDIALELGVSHQTVKRWIHGALAGTRLENKQKAEELRALEVERLDWVLSKAANLIELHPNADIQIKAMGRYLKASEQRAKLLGLEAPTKIAPTDPSGEKPYFEVKPIEYRDVIPAPLEDRPVPNRDPSGQD